MARNFFIGLLLILLIVVFFLFGYKTPLPASAPAGQGQSEAQFGNVSLRLDYATTTAAREEGLGGKTILPSDYGMLFVFPKEDYYGFWMKDTLVPLDIFWLDSQGHVVYIASDVATSTYPNVFYPTDPALYVLETAAGFAQAHNIATGTPLQLKSFPSVSE